MSKATNGSLDSRRFSPGPWRDDLIEADGDLFECLRLNDAESAEGVALSRPGGGGSTRAGDQSRDPSGPCCVCPRNRLTGTIPSMRVGSGTD